MTVRLKNGIEVRNREVMLVAEGGELQERRGSDLEPGDWVALPYGEGFVPDGYRIPLPRPAVGLYGSQKMLRVPDVLNPRLGLLLGMYAAEGHTTPSNWSVILTNADEGVLHLAVELWEECFGLKARITRQADRCPGVVVSSKSLVLWMRDLECGQRARDKRVPWPVMGSSRDVVLAFLQGLALDAYTSSIGANAKWAICVDSPALLDDLQQLLRWMGIVSGRIGKYNPRYDKTFDEVFVSGGHAQALVRSVSFLEASKSASAERLLAMTFDPRRNGADVVPLVHGSVLHALIPKGHGGREGKGTRTAHWRSLCDKRTIWPSRYLVERLAHAGIPLPTAHRRVLEEGMHFSQVRS